MKTLTVLSMMLAMMVGFVLVLYGVEVDRENIGHATGPVPYVCMYGGIWLVIVSVVVLLKKSPTNKKSKKGLFWQIPFLLIVGLAALEHSQPGTVTNLPVVREVKVRWYAMRLDNDHAHIQVFAADALGNMGPKAKGAVPALIAAALDSSRSEVRDAAARALGDIGPDAKGAVPALIGALDSSRPGLRDAAARALGEIGPDAEAAVESLMRIHKDDREQFKKEDTERGVILLSHFTIPPVHTPVHISNGPIISITGFTPSKRISYALVALGKIGEPGLEPFITDLQDKNPSLRQQAAESLGLIILAVPQPKLAQKAMQPLINALQDEDKDTRTAAARAIAEVVFASKNPQTRTTVAKALIRFMKARSATWFATPTLLMIAEAGLEPVISALEDEYTPEPHVGPAVEDPQSCGTTVERLIRIMAHREEIRGEVSFLTGVSHDPDGVPVVHTVSQRPYVSGFGPQVLQMIGEPALQPLVNALQDEDVRMRRVAAMSMQVVLPQVTDPQIRARAVELLIRAMKEADSKVHWYAISALSQMGEPALEPLINALQDEDVRMRTGAAIAMQFVLTDVKDPQIRMRAVEPLIRAMKDADRTVRGLAAVALSKIGTEKAKNALRNAGFDPEP